MESVLCFFRYLLLNLDAVALRADDADFFSCVSRLWRLSFPAQRQGRPSLRGRRGRPEIFEIR